jgi:hypothetical protein
LNSHGLKPEKDDEKSTEEEWLPAFERDLWGFINKVSFLLKRGLCFPFAFMRFWVDSDAEADVNPAFD